ncbi:MAG: carbamoyl phosphate synthase small subunit, partial [Treponema sp.]|nr:carbamoyl phosphate synthase small subunit [Treponema sp.]
MTAFLALQNGIVMKGAYFGAQGDVAGEVVFATGMTGYVETLTDPSYYGQIVMQTFPLIGNYGIIPPDFESANISAKAYIAKYPCQNPSNFRSEGALGAFLRERGIIGLHGIDTRALAKIIRENGVMNGKIMAAPPQEADFEQVKAYSIQNAVAAVSSRSVVKTTPGRKANGHAARRVALMDYGAKRGIAEALAARGCEVWSFPHDTGAEEILEMKPSGIMLSNGPGDPAESANEGVIETIRVLQKSKIPIFGICLGHQLMA